MRPKGFWKCETNRKAFLDEFVTKYQLQKYEDWEKISYHTIRKNGGGGLLKYYKWHWNGALKWYYNTEKDLIAKKLSHKKHRSYWSSLENQHSFLVKLSHTLQLKSLEEFRYLKQQDFLKAEGIGILTHYRMDIERLLKTVFPNYPWSFNTLKDLKLYLLFMQRFFQIKRKEEWYRISFSLILLFHLNLFTNNHSSSNQTFSESYLRQLTCDLKRRLERVKIKSARKTLTVALHKVHNDQEWDLSSLNLRTKKSMQYWMKINLNQLFPMHLILEDYLHPSFQSTQELDLFIPALNIAYEYQGEQHFEEVSNYGNAEANLMKDKEKQLCCTIAGIKLVTIPYWAPSSPSSLLSFFTTTVNETSAVNRREVSQELSEKSEQKTHKLERGFWKNIDNQRQFMEAIINKLNLVDIGELLKIDTSAFYLLKGGASVLSHYNGDRRAALSHIYPNYPFKSSLFISSQNTKSDYVFESSVIKDQRFFMEEMMEELSLKNLEELLYVRSCEIIDRGGRKILKYYNHNRLLMLTSLYPYFPWKSVKFDQLRNNLLSIKLANQVLCKYDWYRLSDPQILSSYSRNSSDDRGIERMKIRTKEALFEALKQFYSDEEWNKEEFSGTRSSIVKRSSQKWLLLCIHQFFPSHVIIEDYSHPKLIYSFSGNLAQLDVFIPSLNLAFEYQGEQHFDELPCFAYTEYYQSNDLEKSELCNQHNIRLITVPYWWDNMPATLFRRYISEHKINVNFS